MRRILRAILSEGNSQTPLLQFVCLCVCRYLCAVVIKGKVEGVLCVFKVRFGGESRK